ncbi:uncharacterized protein LOC123296349 [Chrysoperla carnea]|uniref:uncharacterized protein LOC123296349 n=1 Tax=Chrysoperla carnea TaxID=189513 RepID=UPI001D071C21|nr:uncharacterized protein LOC123296349 [Chrysoperla carnea]
MKCFLFLGETDALFIAPTEVTSFLNVVYSYLATLRAGLDSRIGVGFRLGRHADAQIVLELGPQKYTKPIGATRAAYKSEKLRQSYRNKLKATILGRLSKKNTLEKLRQVFEIVNDRNATDFMNSTIENFT